MEVPTGSRIVIDYSRESPTVSVRIQEVFGLMDTPRVASGRVPLVMELLSPRGTPLQVTSDLANFWATSYTEVRRAPAAAAALARVLDCQGLSNDHSCAPGAPAWLRGRPGIQATAAIEARTEAATPAVLDSRWMGHLHTQVKKEQKGKYPKHYWPDDPSQAEPTKLTKKQMDNAKARQEQQGQGGQQQGQQGGGSKQKAGGGGKRR
jgi:hypothetical protein